MTIMWTLLIAPLAWSQDAPPAEPIQADAPADEPDDADAPDAAPNDAAPEPEPSAVGVKVWTRVGPASASVSKVRAAIETELEALAACWTKPSPGPVEVKVLLKTDGAIEKTKVTTSSLVPDVDTCVAAVIESLSAEVEIDFQEKLGVRVTGPPKG